MSAVVTVPAEAADGILAALDDEQRELLAKLAALRSEERPQAMMGANHKGVFGKIKDAFK